MQALPTILEDWREVIHPAALILPRLPTDEYTELKASIRQHGLLMPIMIFTDDKDEQWLLDGLSRLQALIELGMERRVFDQGRWMPPHQTVEARKGADPHAIVMELNVRRRQLTNEQKRDLVAELRQQRPDLSDRAIAKMAGVSPPTVAAANVKVLHNQIEPIGGNHLPVETQPATDNVRHEASGRQARGRKPGTRPKSQPSEAPRPRRCAHCGAPIDSTGRFKP